MKYLRLSKSVYGHTYTFHFPSYDGNLSQNNSYGGGSIFFANFKLFVEQFVSISFLSWYS